MPCSADVYYDSLNASQRYAQYQYATTAVGGDKTRVTTDVSEASKTDRRTSETLLYHTYTCKLY